jgi:hypothetical protein
MSELPQNLINWDFQSRINRREREQERDFRARLLKQQQREEDKAILFMVFKATALTALALILIVKFI